MRFHVVNLGCKVNRVESDGFERRLCEAGLELAPEPQARLIIVNTCTVTGEAEKKTRKAVRHALRANDFARVIVTGCAAVINAGVFAEMDDRVHVAAKAQVVPLALELAGAEQGEPSTHSPSHPTSHLSSRTRVGVKVQDGCDNACTYCIVHVARGHAVSRPSDEIVAECTALAAAGVREIVLTGINLGSWREDGEGLASLLDRLLEAVRPFAPVRFRLSSIEPQDVDEALIDLLSRAEGAVCRHLHLPLQSGSSKVLREMARRYSAEDYLALVRRLRERVPGISLTTDVIVGFPGETEEDFAATCDLARACTFSKIHVFPYSERKGTPAAKRPDQVPPEQRSRRAAELRLLSDELRTADLASRRGTIELALVEDNAHAMTESYHEMVISGECVPGTLVEVRL